YGADQHEQRGPHFADDVVGEARHDEAAPGLRLREILRELARLRGERTCGARRVGAWRETRHDVERVVAPARRPADIGPAQYDPEVVVYGRDGKVEAVRHDSDDLVFDVAHQDRRTDDGGIGAEAAPPERLAEYDGSRRAGLGIRRDERSAGKRPRAQEVEEIGRDAVPAEV